MPSADPMDQQNSTSVSRPLGEEGIPVSESEAHDAQFNGQGKVSNGLTSTRAPFELIQQWHSQPRKLRIIHVGAGASGICTAFKMERQMTNYELVCYDRNNEVGGNWLQNRYPGCACDVPAHIYTYTFEPNPEWDSYYAYAPQINDYFINFCDKYSLRKYIKLQRNVFGAVWHEDKGQWAVEVEHGGQKFTDWCHLLMNGSGLLHQYKWPDIEGLHDFGGDLLHTGNWKKDADYSNKKVAVLGNGSSAIQVIPQVQKTAANLKCVMRGSTWIASPMPRVPVDVAAPTNGQAEGQNDANYSTFDDAEAATPSVGQYFYTEREKQRLRDDQTYLLDYRKRIEYAINVGFAIFYKDSDASHMVDGYMRAEMARRLENHPVLTEKLIPSWPVGCRRLTPGDGYLEALIKPNVDCVFGNVKRITKTGFEMEDGASHDVDMIICATGYGMAWTAYFRLIGRNGLDIQDAWGKMPKCYLGMGAPGFPNYFVMNGPRGNLANGTVLPCFETEIDYVIQVLKKMQSDRIKALDVKERIVDQLDEYIDAWHETGVFSGPCRSWYKNNTTDGKIRVWGGSSVHFLKTIKTPRFEHFDIEYLDDNPWAFLGNGRIKAEYDGDLEGLTPYLRNADKPWTIE